MNIGNKFIFVINTTEKDRLLKSYLNWMTLEIYLLTG